MPAERFYYNLPFKEKETITLKDQEFHHLVHVMRATQGDVIELIDGKGALAKGHVMDIQKRQAFLHIDEVTFFSLPRPKIVLAQAIPRMPRLDFILEKGTELGMTDLWLFPGQRSERMILTPHQMQRMQNITIAAIKQCGRLHLPTVQIKPALSDWNSLPLPIYYGDTTIEAPQFMTILQNSFPKEGLIFCVGPESGFSEEEISFLKSLNGKGVKLNDFILRTDTAALCALSLISHHSIPDLE